MSEELAGYKVLLFHDKKHHHRHLLSTLRFCGLQDVILTDELQEAIQEIISNRFDLILVTHFGDAREATDLLEELKGHDATSDIPVLAFTEDSSVKELLRIQAKGVDEILVEPISQEDVESTIHSVLQRARDSQAGYGDLKAAHNFVENDELDLALPIFEQALQDDRLAVEAGMGMAHIFTLRKDYPKAESYLKQALNLSKATDERVTKQRYLADVFHAYGKYYERRKQIAKATKSFQTAFQLNPFNTDNMAALMRIMQQEDDLDGLISVIKEVNANYLPFSTALEELAVSVSKLCDRFKSLGMDDHAKKLYRELAQVKHEDSEVHMKVCEFLLEIGEKQQVVKILMEVSSRVKDPDLLHMLGRIFLEDPQGLTAHPANKDVFDLDKAIEIARRAFHQAMLLDPDDIRYRMGLVACELRKGDQDAAQQILEKVRETMGRDQKAYEGVITGLMEEKAFDLAGQWLDYAEQSFPNSSEVSALHADFYKETDQHFEAIACLKKAMAAKPNDLDLLLSIGESYRAVGQFSDAVFYYEKGAQIAPKDERVREGLRMALQKK